MYLNPTLCVASNIGSVEQAWAMSDFRGGTWSNFDYVPSSLNPSVFIGDNKSALNVSSLNQIIGNAMLIEGYSAEELERLADFSVPTIFRSIYNVDSNTFKFNKPGDPTTFQVNLSNLNVGDAIKIIKGKGLPVFTKVVSINYGDDNFVVDCLHPLFDFNETYTLYGIKLYDPMRVAKIGFLTLFTESNNVPDTLVNVTPFFNYELYKVLYPDVRGKNKEDAFLDYVNRFGNNDARVANVNDLLSCGNGSGNGGGSPFSASSEYFSRAHISQALYLDFNQETGRVIWNGLDLYYVTDDPYRSIGQVSPYYQGLITEWAIKTYLNNMFWPLATFCNLVVDGYATFNGNTTMSNLAVRNFEASNALFTGPAVFESDVIVDTLLSGRVGIGYCNINTHVQYVCPVRCNVEFDNVYIDETLYVGSRLQVAGHFIGNNASFGSSVSGNRFGIGPGSDGSDGSDGCNVVSSLIISSNLIAATASLGVVNVGVLDVASSITCFQLSNALTITSNLYVGNAAVCANIESYTSALQTANVAQLNASNIYANSSSCVGLSSTSNLHVSHDTVLSGHVRIGSPGFTGQIVLNVEGIVQAENVDASSDVKLKQNVFKAPESVANVIDNLRIVTYQYKQSHKSKLGFIAQELESLFPEAIYTARKYRSPINITVAIEPGNVFNFGTGFTLCTDDTLIIGDSVIHIEQVLTNSDSDCRVICNTKLCDSVKHIKVDTIIYDKVKMIDYQQVLAALCLKVQQLSSMHHIPTV